MKKIIIVFTLLIFIVSCGEKNYKIYTTDEKLDMVYEYVAIENNVHSNPSLKKEIENNIELLSIAYKKGDSTAKAEYKEWQEIISHKRMYWSTEDMKKFDPTYKDKVDEGVDIIGKDGKLKKRFK